MSITFERPRVDGRVRYPRKIFFGGNLYLLVRPEGGRYWHYHYRYGGKRKTLSLGTYPDVPTALAQARHRAAAARSGRRSVGAEARIAAAER